MAIKSEDTKEQYDHSEKPIQLALNHSLATSYANLISSAWMTFMILAWMEDWTSRKTKKKPKIEAAYEHRHWKEKAEKLKRSPRHFCLSYWRKGTTREFI